MKAIFKSLLVVAGCAALGLSVGVATGQVVIDELRTVTLAARKKDADDDNYGEAAFSFEHGTSGQPAVQLTRNDWDLLFGNSPTLDAFEVITVTDDRMEREARAIQATVVCRL